MRENDAGTKAADDTAVHDVRGSAGSDEDTQHSRHTSEGDVPCEHQAVQVLHHSISDTGLVGGGSIPKPGEISLAHYGVLFLDELPEFSKKALEALRQPLEDGVITITRVNASITYPARTTLICAANPCRCGHFLDGPGKCTCTPRQIQQYLGRLSGPLLDRLDIQVEVMPVKYSELESDKYVETSPEIRKRVERTRKIQLERYKGLGIYSNSQLQPAMFSSSAGSTEMQEHPQRRIRQARMSARAHSRS